MEMDRNYRKIDENCREIDLIRGTLPKKKKKSCLYKYLFGILVIKKLKN